MLRLILNLFSGKEDEKIDYKKQLKHLYKPSVKKEKDMDSYDHEAGHAAGRGEKNPTALPLLRFKMFAEGRAAQILHIK